MSLEIERALISKDVAAEACLMVCPTCGKPVSQFDVHCKNCGTEIKPPPVDDQLNALGIELKEEEPIQLGGRAPGSVARDIGGATARGLWAAFVEFVRAIFRP